MSQDYGPIFYTDYTDNGVGASVGMGAQKPGGSDRLSGASSHSNDFNTVKTVVGLLNYFMGSCDKQRRGHLPALRRGLRGYYPAVSVERQG